MRGKALGTAAAVMAVPGGIAFATPASANLAPPAGSGGWDHIWYGNGSGTLYSEENGDIFELCDLAAGKSASAHIEWGGDVDNYGSFTLQVSGVGACTGSDYTKHDIPEGYEVYIEIFSGQSLVDGTWFVNDH
nr:hypothetical protein OH826_14050 [Streptomyces sp. NBC_00899]